MTQINGLQNKTNDRIVGYVFITTISGYYSFAHLFVKAAVCFCFKHQL